MAGTRGAGLPAGKDAGWTARVHAARSHLAPAAPGTQAATRLPLGSERGFILVFALIMVMGIGTMALGMIMNAKHGQITGQNYKNRIRAFYASDGMRSLLAQEVLDGHAGRYADTASADGIGGEIPFYCERQPTGSSIDLITNLPVLQVVDKPRASWRRDYGERD